MRYPLGVHECDKIRSKTGKKVGEITLENVLNGSIRNDDVKISPETLRYQAEVAESAGRRELARNFRRAGELVTVPDGELLQMYEKLRPNRATKNELLEIAQKLRNYGAEQCAALFLDAAEVYEKRGLFKE